MREQIRQFIEALLPAGCPDWLGSVILLGAIALVAVIFYYLAVLVLRLVEKAVSRTSTTWDDELLNKTMLRAIAQLAPALMVNWLLPAFFGNTEQSFSWLSTATSFYILWAIIRILTVGLSNLLHAMQSRPKLEPYAVKGVFQMVKLVFIGIGVIVGLSMLIGKSPGAIVAALGASAAVLMLVFQDTILGLVASVQLTANKMVQKGEWIEVPGTDANGEVVDISLTTVKIRNWDNTVTTVPPYNLVKGSFRNYDPMQQSGGRRVSRSFYIDASSVRYLTTQELEDLRGSGMLAPEADCSSPAVNLSVLRAYLEHWLRINPHVNHSMLSMVRQMEPTPSGLPIGVYFFSNSVEWKQYEHIMADVFDHIYAIVGNFGLRIFQTPAGSDVLRMGRGCEAHFQTKEPGVTPA